MVTNTKYPVVALYTSVSKNRHILKINVGGLKKQVGELRQFAKNINTVDELAVHPSRNGEFAKAILDKRLHWVKLDSVSGRFVIGDKSWDDGDSMVKMKKMETDGPSM